MVDSNQEEDGLADSTSANNKRLMDAMMAKMLATMNQEFKSMKTDLERTVKERSRRSPYNFEAENHHRNSSRSNDSRMRRHDREARQPRFNQPLGGNNLKIPMFKGTDDPEEYLDWEEKIEFVFSCREYKQEHKLMLAPTEFRGYALIWWEKLVAAKKRAGDLPVESWNQMKNLMRRRFVPSHYHRKPKRAQEGREHQQGNLEQQKKSRGQAGNDYYHHDEPRSLEKAKHLQKKLSEQKLYDEVRKQVVEAFNSVEARQKKNPATRHSTEATKEKPSCAKEPSQIVKHLPLLMKPLEAKCDLSSTLFDFVPKKLTNLEPVKPSSIVSVPQILEGESHEELSAKTESSLCEVDSEVASEVDYEVASKVQSCEKEKRPETYLSLVCPVFKPHEPPDLASRGIIITTEPTQHLLLGAQISETHNLIHYWQTFLTGHSFKLYVLNFPTSSIMHLSCSMSAQKDAGTLEKHQSLGVGDALYTLAIKGKPPDLQELQPNQRGSKRGTMSELKDVTRANDVLVYHQERKLTSYFQFKDEPPDAAFKLQLSQYRIMYKGDQTKNVQEYRLPHFVLSICVKEEPPDLEVILSRFFEGTGTAGVVLMQAKKRKRRTTKREEDERFKPPDLDQGKHQDISVSLMIKEAPPDKTYNPKPNPNRFQGKDNMSSSFTTNFVSFCADKTDLRTNPFQVGEDDMIMASKEVKETEEHKDQLEPELNGVKHGALEQLEAVEAKELEEEDHHISLGPITRTKSKKLHEATFSLLHLIRSQLEYACPTTMVVIQAT